MHLAGSILITRLTNIKRCSAICCLYVPDLAPEFIANAVAFLDDTELSVDLATLISVIEALCLVGVQ
jgi:hypothetical protein